MKLRTKLILITITTFHISTYADNSIDIHNTRLTQSVIEDTFTIEEERFLVSSMKENASAQNALLNSVNKISTDFNSGKLTEQNMASYLTDYLNNLAKMHTPASLITLQKQMAADANERIIKQNSTRSDVFKYFLRNLSELNKTKQTSPHKQIPDNIIVDISRLLGAFYNSPELQPQWIETNGNMDLNLSRGLTP